MQHFFGLIKGVEGLLWGFEICLWINTEGVGRCWWVLVSMRNVRSRISVPLRPREAPLVMVSRTDQVGACFESWSETWPRRERPLLDHHGAQAYCAARRLRSALQGVPIAASCGRSSNLIAVGHDAGCPSQLPLPHSAASARSCQTLHHRRPENMTRSPLKDGGLQAGLRATPGAVPWTQPLCRAGPMR